MPTMALPLAPDTNNKNNVTDDDSKIKRRERR